MKRYKPMLASDASEPFDSADWIFEVKWDGIRALAYLDDGVKLKSRNGNELIDRFPELKELEKLGKDLVVDGEIILMREDRPDFQGLVERSNTTGAQDIDFLSKTKPVTYIVFDILEKEGKSLIDKPLLERKRILNSTLKEGDYLVLSRYVEKEGKRYYKAVLDKGLEGIVAKRKDSPYRPGRRSRDWQKIKKLQSCDCVVFGYTLGKGNRQGDFGALLLGVYDKGRPVYVGKVGTGFDSKERQRLLKIFTPLESKKATIEHVDLLAHVVWLKPELVAKVGYQVVTKDGRLRMPRYQGLREDKNPVDCLVDQIRPPDLDEYKVKRDFNRTPEPSGGEKRMSEKLGFVVHEHHARRLHFDLRLEREGVLKSWAVPKGPPEKPGDKRLAIQVEDHPLDYGEFEGTIPKGEYGAGEVSIWDKGLYKPLHWDDEKVEVLMMGEKLKGRYELVRFMKAGEKEWLFFKAKE